MSNQHEILDVAKLWVDFEIWFCKPENVEIAYGLPDGEFFKLMANVLNLNEDNPEHIEIMTDILERMIKKREYLEKQKRLH